MSESREAFHELLDALKTVEERYLGEEWGLVSDEDVGEGVRSLMHVLQGALVSFLEDDPAHPRFRRIVTPTRKFLGDNADAIYYDAPVSADYEYLATGNRDGAVYFSITIEAAATDGSLGGGTLGVLNDDDIDVAEDGSFEITLGGELGGRNRLPLLEGAARITTRHYYENDAPAAADPQRNPALSIDVTGERPPWPTVTDASVAESVRRVTNCLQTRTLGLGAPGTRDRPEFVSVTPNEFPAPVKPGAYTLSAADAAYSMAPFVLGPEDALVIRGRWPECRMGCVSMWNRHMQTFDYVNRSVSLNRKQTVLDEDGGFTVVIAHTDPGVPNWLDTEGRAFGIVFWRFMLPEGDIEKPRAEVVPFAEIARA